MHHRDEVTSPAIAGAKSVPKNKSNEKASCLGKSELHLKGLVPLKRIVRSNDQRVVQRPVEPAPFLGTYPNSGVGSKGTFDCYPAVRDNFVLPAGNTFRGGNPVAA